MKYFLVALFVAGICANCLAADTQTPVSTPFSDVPSNHWAASSVITLADLGLVKGYPDGTFRGNQTVTRYELAAALARFTEFIQASMKPAGTDSKPEKSDSEQTESTKSAWYAGPINTLKQGNYLPQDSPIITDGSGEVTEEDLAQALASIMAKIIEQNTTDPGPTDVSQRQGVSNK